MAKKSSNKKNKKNKGLDKDKRNRLVSIYALLSSISFFILAVIRIMTISNNYTRMRASSLIFLGIEIIAFLLLSCLVIRRKVNVYVLFALALNGIGSIYGLISDLKIGNPLVMFLNSFLVIASVLMLVISYYSSDCLNVKRVKMAVKYSSVPAVLVFVDVAICMLLVWYSVFLVQLFLYLVAYYTMGKVIAYSNSNSIV